MPSILLYHLFSKASDWPLPQGVQQWNLQWGQHNGEGRNKTENCNIEIVPKTANKKSPQIVGQRPPMCSQFLSETLMRFRLMLSAMSAIDEMIFWNISETIRDYDFKMYDRVALDSFYVSTGNDVINYFRSEANPTNV